MKKERNEKEIGRGVKKRGEKITGRGERKIVRGVKNRCKMDEKRG